MQPLNISYTFSLTSLCWLLNASGDATCQKALPFWIWTTICHMGICAKSMYTMTQQYQTIIDLIDLINLRHNHSETSALTMQQWRFLGKLNQIPIVWKEILSFQELYKCWNLPGTTTCISNWIPQKSLAKSHTKIHDIYRIFIIVNTVNSSLNIWKCYCYIAVSIVGTNPRHINSVCFNL